MPKPRAVPDIHFVFHPAEDAGYVHFVDHVRAPFNAGASMVTRANAWWLAEAALLSYWDASEVSRRCARVGLEVRFLEAGDTQGYVAWNDMVVMVSFRGTESGSLGDVIDDKRLLLVPWSHGLVHRGFKGALERVWPALIKELAPLAPSRTVWFSGHSLGAAVATLAAHRYDTTAGLCTFGSPRVGDRIFAAQFEARFGARALRYINDADIVCHLPPPFGYKHVGHVRQIAADGSISAERTLPHFVPAVFGRLEHLKEVADGLQAGVLRTAPDFLLDHMPRGYAVDLWNDYVTHLP